MYNQTRLENGTIIATAEMPQMASVSLGVWVGIGSRYEPSQINGICHFIEHLLFKGTARRSAREISQAVEGVGGYLNAFTAEETTCFHARAGHEYFEELLDVLMDMFLHSKFAPQDISKERRVIKEEIAMYLDEPQHQVQELLNATLWPDQPLGRPITGTPGTLDAVNRQHLIKYLRDNYISGNTLLVAAGRLKHRQVVQAVRNYVMRVRNGQRPPLTPVYDHQQSKPRINLFTKDTEQTQVAIGIRTCSRHDQRRYALRLLNVILGENMSSRLFQVVREDRGLAYSIYSSPSFFHDTGDLVISAGLETDKLPQTLKLILRELRRLVETPPSRGELRRACDYVIGQMNLSLESTDSQMNWMGEQLLAYGRIFQPEEVKRHLRQVTPGQIRSAARDFFRAQNLNVALVSPLKSEKSFARAIHSFSL
jgi:predicted Zn-dependent peptidase